MLSGCKPGGSKNWKSSFFLSSPWESDGWYVNQLYFNYSAQVHDTTVFHDLKVTKLRFVSCSGHLVSVRMLFCCFMCMPRITLHKCKLSVGRTRAQAIHDRECSSRGWSGVISPYRSMVLCLLELLLQSIKLVGYPSVCSMARWCAISI